MPPLRSAGSLALRSVRPLISASTSSSQSSRLYHGPLPPPRKVGKLASLRQIETPKAQTRAKERLQEDINNPNPTEWLLPIPEPKPKTKQPIRLPGAIPSVAARNPIAVTQSSEIALRDPTGARTRLFDPKNLECINVRDIVLVRQRTGEPFSGVVIRLLRKGIDTSILMRNTLTGVGVEMEFKIYSPNVTSIEVVKRREKVPKQDRLYYLRKPEHDVGSVENIVRQYLRQKSGLGLGGDMKKGRRK